MDSALILVAVIIICCILFDKISDKIGLPMLLVFILLGMLFGVDGIFKFDFDNYLFAEQICSTALIFIIFYGGFGTKWREAKKVAGKSLLLSSAGVIITALSVGLFCRFVLGFELLEGMLIGAVLSSTDAASVFSLLRSKNLNLKYHTASILELESGSNDPWAYMLTIIILSLISGDITAGSFMYMIFAQIVFGVLFGTVIAFASLFVLNHMNFETAGFDTIFVAAVAILAYALPSSVGGNGYLSAYIVGIILGNAKIQNKPNLVHFFDGLTGFSQILIFFLLGLLVTPSQLIPIILPALAIAVFLTLIARPLAVSLLMKPFKASFRQQAVISWAGLRGATSIVFAIMAIVDDIYTKNDVFNIVFCVVLISIGIQGTLLPFVCKKSDMIDMGENVLKTFNDYSDETEVQFIRLNINKGGGWDNKKISELTIPPGILIVMILRNKEKIIPTGNTVLLPDDILVLSAEGFYDDKHFILSEVTVDGEHKWCGKSISQISIPKGNLIVMIKRDNKTLIPNGQIKIHQNDVLVISGDDVKARL